jgi:transposase
MQSRKTLAEAVDRFIELMVSGRFGPDDFDELEKLGPESVKLVMLAASARIAKLAGKLEGVGAAAKVAASPSRPSGQRAPFEKSGKKRKRRKKPGAKPGHAGASRAVPERIDREETKRLDVCPDCSGALNRNERTRTRIIEDLTEEIRALATCYTIYRDYCPNCKKDVEPPVDAAMPGATLGHGVVVLSAWFHYGLGLTVSQVVEIFKHHLQTKITAGGLMQAWQRLAETLTPWYQQIGEGARASSYLHADETGWRVNGVTYWLWCFCNGLFCYYMIDPSRGHAALMQFFKEAFEGVLITDFWHAYWAVVGADWQCCIVHLLREVSEVDKRENSPEWQAFSKKLRRLLTDGVRLKALRSQLSAEEYDRRCRRIHDRLLELGSAKYAHPDAKRLGKRLWKHRDHIFTFLDYDEVTPDNNRGERGIRPAVVIRKNILNNRSDKGAETQSVLMSIFQTLRMRGLSPTQTVIDALKAVINTDQLPPLPPPTPAAG